MPKWNLSVREETDHLVRGFLARTGMKKGDLSAFVEDAVQSEVLKRSARQLQEKDPKLSDEEAKELAENLAALERGVADVRAGRGRPMKEAIRDIANELGLKLDR